jgi:phage tail-like protein
MRQPRARYIESATVVTPLLDSGEAGCTWHRALLDAVVPTGSAIAIWSAAADDMSALVAPSWRPEPQPRPRSGGPELPFVERGRYDTHELLFQKAKGRYLKLRIDLLGDSRCTPRVRALRVWFPRFSYLHRYLPAAYREDPDSASFLERYLANIEGLATSIEDRIACAQVLLSPRTAPSDAVDWLASWLGLALDPMWDERRRRLFLAHAMEFYAARGTIRGIDIALRFVLDQCVTGSAFDYPQPPALRRARIVESFRTRTTPGVVFGDTGELVPSAGLAVGDRWDPTKGRDALISAYADYQTAARIRRPMPFPVHDPGPPASVLWRAFCTKVLGFVPGIADAALWAAFLRRRYANVEALASAYGVPVDTLQVTPPDSLPANGAALVDWYQFQAVVVPTVAAAHRFTVLLPWPLTVLDAGGSALDQSELRALATRVVELQKPAHTIFDVRFFWAAFRVGEARLQSDTQLGTGSRAPELLEPAVIGGGHLGSALLGGQPPSSEVARVLPQTLTTEKEAL